MYGAAAAVERADHEGLELLVDDLCAAYPDVATLLTVMSFLTLDRLDAALEASHAARPLSADARRSLAEKILEDANGYAVTDAVAVNAAARRLDSVRRWDTVQVAAEVASERSITSDANLLYGAAALLTATVAVWADTTGKGRAGAIRELCLESSAKL